ncbi:polysaccharide deacetylase family protein [Epibacterium ulvae]|uniref:polysaccharide deacetylase family protein n=1 Tax=Epibacterium ulvae TaxID=1156985 RepID=UPI001BFC859C|nr:polysaccharide deacetylase family protein [Epibacterium ulvae]MBT8152716.1 polysaccharide deacetylase family protein [Epibacterium ulvae]
MIWSPPAYAWPAGKQAAACFSVDVDADAPYLWATRNGRSNTLAVPEHRSYGMRRGMARLVNLLDRLNIKGSFFVPGGVAEANPDLLPGLLERGHEIALHGYGHELVNDISDQEFTEALEQSIELFVKQTGQRPAGFRSPAWEMTPHMLAELGRLGLWDSSLMGDDVPYTLQDISEIPVRWDIDDAIYFKFLGAGEAPPRSHLEIGAVWHSEAQAALRHGTLFMMTIHDWICTRPARIEMLEALWRPIVENDGFWCATCGALAAHHTRHVEDSHTPNDQGIS